MIRARFERDADGGRQRVGVPKDVQPISTSSVRISIARLVPQSGQRTSI
jgi:hypothetical protein